MLHYKTGLHNLWQPGSRAVRKWRENEKMKRKLRENEEMERNGQRMRKWREIHSLPFLIFSFVEMVVILARVVSSIDEMRMRTVVMSSFTPTLGQRSIWTIQPSCFQFYS